MGSYGGMERKLAEAAGLPFEGILTGKWRRYFAVQNGVDLLKIPLGTAQAFLKLLKLRPSVVFSKGGFVGVPVVLAAGMIGIPVYIHESDAIPGLATKLCAPFARKIFLGYAEAEKGLQRYKKKLQTVGNPVREDLFEGSAAAARKWAGFVGKKPVLLVMGGSSGSLEINKKIEKEKKAIMEEYAVVHITGEGKNGGAGSAAVRKKDFIAVPFVGEEIKDLYALASLALTRAGAGALAELEALQIPALLFPLGMNASRGDQVANAKALCKKSKYYRIGDTSLPLREQLAALPKRPPRPPRATQNATQIIAHTLT